MAVPPSIAKLSLEELQKLTVECLKKLKVRFAGCSRCVWLCLARTAFCARFISTLHHTLTLDIHRFVTRRSRSSVRHARRPSSTQPAPATAALQRSWRLL